MIAVLQVVSLANVSVDQKIVSSISTGFLILLGVEIGDTEAHSGVLIDKIVKMRTFPDESAKKHFESSIADIKGEILVVSQFTLPATFESGRRPEFSVAMKPQEAEIMYNNFVSKLRSVSGLEIKTGVFGAMMNVSLTNSGPITYILDSKRYV